MFSKKKILLFACVLILGIFVYVFTPKVEHYLTWKRAVKAAGGFPYQIGLVNVVITPCATTGTPPVCTGGTLCYIKDAATCLNYSDVSGTPAGGMGSNALFANTAISQAGLISGGQLIAGGMGPTLMDSGVLASAGGCAGCAAKADLTDRIAGWLKFIIAGKRGN